MEREFYKAQNITICIYPSRFRESILNIIMIAGSCPVYNLIKNMQLFTPCARNKPPSGTVAYPQYTFLTGLTSFGTRQYAL